jgi:spore germination protein YaaH
MSVVSRIASAVAVTAVQVGLLAGAVAACAAPNGADGASGDGGGPAPLGGGLRVTGYLVPWDPRSEPTVGAGVVTEVSPVWYQPTDAGAVVFASAEARASSEVFGSARAPLTPSISNFRAGRWDGELVSRLIADPQRRAAHVATIVELVRAGGWPGIDIDYESLPAASRASYRTFVAELARALHRLPARLSVTVHAKTAEPGEWSGAQAQDWRAIGAAADEVRVMAYDYSSAGSPPGPIAPRAWVEKVVKLAATLIPRDRVALGLPTYGYDWTGGAGGAPVQWADVAALAGSTGAQPQWDAGSSSPWLRYHDGRGRQHTVWYEDARSLAVKLEVARRYGLTRVVLWRLGGEDPAIWPALRIGPR